tara:strand:+ start:169 stop:657 length:489 start_codon:yes stop_codon:yes gene_type:complete
MKKFLPFIMIMMAVPAAKADLTHRLSSSVQLQVNSAATQATRLGNSYAISGNNVNTTDGTTAGTISTGAVTSGIYSPGAIVATQKTAGEAFSFSASFTQADVIPTSAATTGEIQNFGNMTSNAAGTAGNLAGTIDSLGKMSLTAGGAGTSAIGQFSSDIIIK